MSHAHPNLEHYALGVDIGGTGIKVSLVDVKHGELAFKRVRILTPKPATPDAVVATVDEALGRVKVKAVEEGIVGATEELDGLPLGVAFPGVFKEGTVIFAPNLDQSWIGEDLLAHVTRVTGHEAHAVNDADAAGVAEMSYGAGRQHRKDAVIVTTLGTGIGSAVFVGGHLFPFTELGHIEIDGREAEHVAAESVKVREELSYEDWAVRLQRYYSELEKLFNPDLFIVGGGVSKSHEKFLPLLELRAPIVPAGLRNDAGLVGAAVIAHNHGKAKVKK